MSERPNPYVGARPFTEDDTERFFGRRIEIRDLTSHREVVLFSQSGAGKSSLLRAGVFPRLKARGFHVLQATRLFGYVPAGASGTDSVRNIYAFNALSGWPLSESQCARLPRLTLREYVEEMRAGDRSSEEPRLRVVMIDQFEELFTKYPERWPDREPFLAELAEALEADRRLRVILAVREEYVGRLRTLGAPFPGETGCLLAERICGHTAESAPAL